MSSRKRHITKAITWRIVGTVDTTILGWIFTGNPFTGLQIGLAEVITKTGLYYLHERLWFKINRRKYSWLRSSRRRHIIKTFTWRGVGTIDTMILAWIISGNPMVGLKVGAAELVTKMVLYYAHERLWYRSKFGLHKKDQDPAEAIFD